MDIKELAEAREKAVTEKKWLTIIVSNKSYGSDAQGVEVIQPKDVAEQGSKAFRDVKKTARNLKKNRF